MLSWTEMCFSFVHISIAHKVVAFSIKRGKIIFKDSTPIPLLVLTPTDCLKATTIYWFNLRVICVINEILYVISTVHVTGCVHNCIWQLVFKPIIWLISVSNMANIQKHDRRVMPTPLEKHVYLAILQLKH